MSDKALKRSFEGFLKMLRNAARRHKNGLLHYTTMPSFKSMVDSKKVYFSLLQSSNDKGEYEDNRYYMMCFTYGKEENIGMWGIYGVPRKKSIRLKFRCRHILAWLESTKNKNLQYYGVKNRGKNRGNLVLLKNANPKVSICDVAYYSGNDDNIFTHNGKTYRVTCDGQSVDKPCKDPRLAPFAKKWAWSYEREVRIVLEFDKPVLDSKGKLFRRIAVDFEEPLAALLKGEGGILLGPWYKRLPENVQKRDYPKAKVTQSDFRDVINLRTPCFDCDKVKRLKRMLCQNE